MAYKWGNWKVHFMEQATMRSPIVTPDMPRVDDFAFEIVDCEHQIDDIEFAIGDLEFRIAATLAVLARTTIRPS